ncbi:MAG: DNA-processing protein DprA [Lachnospiraceae bacterium]|jgi:DNA processing protein|nr:DNA-processing protein DprA [Lachnospiraceae bacterium]
MDNEKAYQYWLHSVDGIGMKTITLLSSHIGRASDVYRLSAKELKWFLNESQLLKLEQKRRSWDITGEFARLKAKGITFVPYGDNKYPEKLKNLSAPPASLYIKGTLPDPTLPAVALIGTRKCSGYGASMAKRLGLALAKAQIEVISGMARGIDGIGQKAVSETGGRTFAVLGCGVDVIYPEENAPLYRQIVENGGIISEYSPGTAARSALFPPRNRLISGLADAVIVVEARDKSGTMITVDMALEQGKDIYSLPGRATDPLSVGCNRLIKQGASPVVSVEEFVAEILSESKRKLSSEVISLKKRRQTKGGTKNTASEDRTMVDSDNDTLLFSQETLGFEGDEEVLTTMNSDEQAVWAGLDYTPRSLGFIAELCPQIGYQALLSILIKLCLKGVVMQMGTGNYCRAVK